MNYNGEKVMEIPKDIIVSVNVQSEFEYYLYIKFDLERVAIKGYTYYFRVESSKGNFAWNHKMMNLHLGYEVDVETRYDLKMEINPNDAHFEIIESSIIDERCNEDHLLYIWNKIMEKVIKQ